MRMIGALVTALLLALSLCACAPEVGSRAWCEDMQDKPKGDWSANDAKAYAKYCVFENYTDKED